MNLSWVDTHCHLDAAEFDADRQKIIGCAQAAGVAKIVVPSIGRRNFARVASLCEEMPNCFAAFGIHPLYVAEATDDDLAALRDLLTRARPVAVGEIGLDYYRPPFDAARQEHFFVEQLKIAADVGLPVLLHVRKAVDAILKQLRRIRVVGGIAHAFNGSFVQAEQFIELGFKLGFGGAMTHPRAKHLQALARSLPLAAIVLETDAPDIPPAWLHPGRNEPAQLPRIGAVLAELRGCSLEEIATMTVSNSAAVLPAIGKVP